MMEISHEISFFHARFTQAETKIEKVSPLQMNYEAKNLKKQEQYEFWVTASTNVGEGQPSKTLTVAPNSRGKSLLGVPCQYNLLWMKFNLGCAYSSRTNRFVQRQFYCYISRRRETALPDCGYAGT